MPVHRAAQNNPVAHVGEGAHRAVQRLNGAVRIDHRLGPKFPAEALPEPAHHRGRVLRLSPGSGVAIHAKVRHTVHRVQNGLRGAKIHVRHHQGEDGLIGGGHQQADAVPLGRVGTVPLHHPVKIIFHVVFLLSVPQAFGRAAFVQYSAGRRPVQGCPARFKGGAPLPAENTRPDRAGVFSQREERGMAGSGFSLDRLNAVQLHLAAFNAPERETEQKRGEQQVAQQADHIQAQQREHGCDQRGDH